MDNKGFTVACAESVTGGALSSAFTKFKGASKYFLGSVVAYQLDIKHRILGVDKDMAKECNCVSKEVARQMAYGVSKALKSDIGIATCGYASNISDLDPDYISKNNIKSEDLPYAYVCIYDGRETTNESNKYTVEYVSLKGATRISFINYIASKAYNMILSLD